MISAARCLIQPSFKIQSILRAILRDEILSWNKKTTANVAAAAAASTAGQAATDSADGNSQQQAQDSKDREVIIEKVTNAVKAILSRLNRQVNHTN